MKRIRTRSIKNVETERLLARLRYIDFERAEIMRAMEQKVDVRACAREVVNIERELTRREVTFTPVSNGEHLAIDVHDVPTIMPPPSWKERHSCPTTTN